MIAPEDIIVLQLTKERGLQGPVGPIGSIENPVNHVQLNPAPIVPAHQEGVLFWDADDHTLGLMTEVSGTVLQVGQESLLRARNTSGSTISDGSVVYVSGATGNRPKITKAIASDDTNVDAVIGVATADITHNSDGYVTVFGIVRGINTSAFLEGDTLYLSATTAGGLTKTKPTYPNVSIKIGTVVVAGNNGAIFVAVDNGAHLSDAHDVMIDTPAVGDLLQWDGSKWVNAAALTGWDDLRFPASAINPLGAVADPQRNANTGVLEFAGNADNIIAGVAQMPHSWKRGSAIYPHLHLRFITSAAGNTRWKLEYDISDADTPFIQNYGTYSDGGTITVANPQNAKREILASFNPIQMTGLKESAVVLWRITRLASTDALDTDTTAVALLEYDIHYEVDKIGTETQIPS